MKRSELNRYIAEADAFFAKNHFMLPPFAQWTPQEWETKGPEVNEIRDPATGLGRDGFRFGRLPPDRPHGLHATNGLSPDGEPSKVYAEKIIYVREGQVTPFHYHASRMVDTLTEAGREARWWFHFTFHPRRRTRGNPSLCFLRWSSVSCRRGRCGDAGSGQSVTLPPFLYHTFYAVDGDALIGEVSSLNNDDTDNFFLDKLPRYPAVVEDEAPTRLLCTEYHLAPSGA